VKFDIILYCISNFGFIYWGVGVRGVGLRGVVVPDVGVRLRFFVVEEVFDDLSNSFLFTFCVLLGVNTVESTIFLFGDDFELDTGDFSNSSLFTLGYLLGVNTVEDSSVLFCMEDLILDMGEVSNRFFASIDLLLDINSGNSWGDSTRCFFVDDL
jgi:hypothetical protein